MSALNSVCSVCTDSGTIIPAEVVRLVNATLLSKEELELYNEGGDIDAINIALDKGVPLSNFIEKQTTAKLNYVRCTLQAIQNEHLDEAMIEQSLGYLEDIRDAFDRLYPIPLATATPTS